MCKKRVNVSGEKGVICKVKQKADMEERRGHNTTQACPDPEEKTSQSWGSDLVG